MRPFLTRDTQYWVDQLGLEHHPEGGYWVQTYRCAERLAAEHLPSRFGGPRIFSSAIYYLLKGGDRSVFHRIKSDEIWHFYDGSPLTLYAIDPAGTLVQKTLGNRPEKGQSFQVLVTAGCWFGALVNDPSSYTLAGCTVAPGFEFEDFELGCREILTARYPRHKDLIERLT